MTERPRKFCSNCGAEIDEKAKICPECGVDLLPFASVDRSPAEAKKRPTGLAIIAVIWFLGGIFNLYMSSQAISADLEALPLLQMLPEWFKLGIPAELGINLLSFSLGLFQLFTIYGLWTGKSWSYKLALAIPVLGAVSWILLAALYMSAPAELGLGAYINWVAVTTSIGWVGVYWWYLRRPHVKEYLRAPP